MMQTWIALAILGYSVVLNAALEDFEFEHKGRKVAMRPAFENKKWGGVDHKPERIRYVTDDRTIWRVEAKSISMEWSQIACRQNGGRLIAINSKEKYNELAKELYMLSTDIPYWIGLNDKDEDGKYIWQMCPWGNGGVPLKDEMNLPFDNPDSYWGWQQPSKTRNPWGDEEDCGQLGNWGIYDGNLSPPEGRPVDPRDKKMQFRFNDVMCVTNEDFAMPLCENRTVESEEENWNVLTACGEPEYEEENTEEKKSEEKKSEENTEEDTEEKSEEKTEEKKSEEKTEEKKSEEKTEEKTEEKKPEEKYD